MNFTHSTTMTVFVGACLAAAVLPLAGGRVLPATAAAVGTSTPRDGVVDWPTHLRGQPLAQLPLSPLEARFATRFPGAIARFSDGRQQWILRHVTQPTRQLHPAADCFRAAGFSIDTPRAHTADDGSAWTCFIAERDGQRQRVCERIIAGTLAAPTRAWTDVSAWYWAALTTSSGPWWAQTVVTPLGPRT